MDDNSYRLVEKLVSTVGRAFYSDSHIVLLDTLFRETYVVEEELGPRLKMRAIDTRKLTTQLESEMLIKFENVNLAGDNRSFLKCYYIDYEQFVNVIRYRIHLMQKMMESDEKMERNVVYYECPTCHDRYSLLQAQSMLSGDFKFICTYCCPHDNFRSIDSEAFYRLVEVDTRGKADNVHSLHRKLEEQLSRSNYHDGLFDLLYELRDIQLPNNRPSDNIKSGIRSSAVEDADVIEEIHTNFDLATGAHGASLIRKKVQKKLGLIPDETDPASLAALLPVTAQTFLEDNGKAPDFSINIENNGKRSAPPLLELDAAAAASAAIYAKRDASYPQFLQDSRVLGAKEVLEAAHTLQAQRKLGEGQEDRTAKRQKLSGEAEDVIVPLVENRTIVAQEDGGDDMDDDLEWEEDDDINES